MRVHPHTCVYLPTNVCVHTYTHTHTHTQGGGEEKTGSHDTGEIAESSRLDPQTQVEGELTPSGNGGGLENESPPPDTPPLTKPCSPILPK